MAAFSGEDGPDGTLGGLVAGTSFQTSLVAKVLAGLFAAGATLAALTVVLPHPTNQNELGLLAIVANAYVIAAVLLWRARELPAWTLPPALAWGSTLITGVAYFSGESPSPLVFFYLWIFLYASYFLTRKEAALQIGYVGLAYGALLISRPPSSGVPAWWLVGMGTLLVAAILIMTMRVRVELLIAKLYEAARSDPLTKLSNRRGFRELLDLDLERARRGETEMTVLVGDLDRFKEVNDHAGHQVGDVALQRVARVLSEGKRQIDSAARVGGEEFALILPDTPQDGAFVLAERHVSRVRLAGMLHDIGKVGVPDSILRKPGPLTDQEFTAIKRHPELGVQILEHPSLADVRQWVGAHHERPDGLGYPLGLSGEQLALEARIVAVADAYEAMTSDRSYRDSIGHARARAELQRCAGSQFDLRVVEAFLAALRREGERAHATLTCR